MRWILSLFGNHKMFLLLCLSLVLRIFITGWSLQFRENTDVLRYKDWARIAYLYGFSDTYTPRHLTFGTLANNQPPGSLYVLSAAYRTELQFAKIFARMTHTRPGQNVWVNGPLVSIFLRIPSILGDLILGIMLYILAKKYASKKAGIIASSLFLFNPVILYNSAFWGQTDSINNCLFILSLFFLLRKNHFLSVLFFGLSLFVKLSLIIFLPLYLILCLRLIKKTAIFTILVCIVLLFSLFILPVSSHPFLWFWKYLLESSKGEMQNITAFAFNGWWVIFRPWIAIGKPTDLFSFSQITLLHSPLSGSGLWGIPLEIIAYGLFFAFIAPLVYFMVKTKITLTTSVLLFSLCALVGFLFFPRMHERYLYPLFPLLALYSSITGTFFMEYALLSILNTINLYVVWHPLYLPLLSYPMINNQEFQWSIAVVTLIVSIHFFIRGIKCLKKLTYEK